MFTWENDPTINRVGRSNVSRTRATSTTSASISSSAMKASLRDPMDAQAPALSSVADAWAMALPPALRPVQLCSRYPRVANRLALCWPDLGLTMKLFDDLFIDRRGGRRGFPPDVKAELTKLRDRASRERAVRSGETATVLQRMLADIAG